MNYFWILDNIDKASDEDVRKALKALLKDNKRLNSRVNQLSDERKAIHKLLKDRTLHNDGFCLDTMVEAAIDKIVEVK